MSPLLFVFLVLTHVVAAANAQTVSAAIAPYYCNVMGAPCQNGAQCNFTSSLCTCGAGFSGYDCGIDANDASCPAANCSGNGVCGVTGGGTLSCHCALGFYGSRCEHRRIGLDCYGGYMNMTIFAFGIPANIFLQISRYNCSFSAQSALLGQQQFSLTYASGCGGQSKFNITKNGVPYVGYSAVAEVAYILNARSINDYTINFTCLYPADGAQLSLEERAGISNIELNLAPTAGNQTFEVDPIDMEVKAGDGVSELTVFMVGVHASLVFYLDTSRGYSDMQLMALMADDGTSIYSLSLLENGCLTANSMPIYILMSKVVTKDRITFTFTLFKFTSSANVNFVAYLRACTGPCSALTCSPAGFPMATRVGRKKRSVVDNTDLADLDLDFKSEEGTTVYSMGRTLKLTGFDLQVDDATPAKKSPPVVDLGDGHYVTDPIGSCVRSWPYIVTVIAFTLILCVFVTVAFVLRTRINTMQRHHFSKLKFGVPME